MVKIHKKYEIQSTPDEINKSTLNTKDKKKYTEPLNKTDF